MPNLKLGFYSDGSPSPSTPAEPPYHPKRGSSGIERVAKVVVSSTNIEPSTTARPDRTRSDPVDGSHHSTIEVGR